MFPSEFLLSVAALIAACRFLGGGASAAPAPSPPQAAPVREDTNDFSMEALAKALAADDEAMQVSYQAASVLGLQRSAKITKKKKTQKAGEAAVAESDDRGAIPIPLWPLGLQRSMTVTQGKAALVEEDATVPANFGLEDASILGLQRSTSVTKSEAILTEDDGGALSVEEDGAAKSGAKAGGGVMRRAVGGGVEPGRGANVPAAVEAVGEIGAAFAGAAPAQGVEGLSTLGPQRSATVMRRQATTAAELPFIEV